MSAPLILISGATATGKTVTALKLAQIINGEIINGDSLLFYSELNIGTAKPSPQELQRIPHHLINCTDLKSPFNASDYVTKAKDIISALHAKNKIPLIVGGSAFYIRALLKGMYERGNIAPKVRDQLDQLEKTKGWRFIREELKRVDPESYQRIHENDRYRTLRALEYYQGHGTPLSQERRRMEDEGPYDFSKLQDPSWKLHHIYLNLPKDFHWKVMEKRAYQMITDGLIEETKEILDRGFDPQLKPLQSIGYKETIQYLQGEISRQELPQRIFINTRRLAKSQKTFFNKITPKNTYHPIEKEDIIIDETLSFLKRS